jgi:hypothetical protein
LFKPIAILPLHFLSQTATRKQNNQVLIKWSVEQQEDIKQYEIERSNDGIRFSSIGLEVGKMNGEMTYQLIDGSASDAIQYYRVVAVTLGGQRLMSNVFRIDQNTTPIITSMSGSVIQDKLHLKVTNFNKGSYQMILRNSLGQLLKSQKIDIHAPNQKVEIDLKLVRNIGECFITLVNTENNAAVTCSLLMH